MHKRTTKYLHYLGLRIPIGTEGKRAARVMAEERITAYVEGYERGAVTVGLVSGEVVVFERRLTDDGAIAWEYTYHGPGRDGLSGTLCGSPGTRDDEIVRMLTHLSRSFGVAWTSGISERLVASAAMAAAVQEIDYERWLATRVA